MVRDSYLVAGGLLLLFGLSRARARGEDDGNGNGDNGNGGNGDNGNGGDGDNGNGGDGNGDPDPETDPVLEEGFSSGYADRSFTSSWRQGEYDSSVSVHGRSDALKVTLWSGNHYGMAASYQPHHANHVPAKLDEVWAEYDVYFDPGFDILPGGMKLPGPADTSNDGGWGGRQSDGTNGWSARGRAESVGGGNIRLGYYVYHMDMGTYGSNHYAGEVPVGQWVTVRQHARVNDVGSANGELEMWLDGDLGLSETDFRFRSTADLGVEQLWFNVYHGGNDPSPRDQNVYFDNLRVWADDPGW